MCDYLISEEEQEYIDSMKPTVREIYLSGACAACLEVDVLDSMNDDQLKVVKHMVDELLWKKNKMNDQQDEIKKLRDWSWRSSIRKMQQEVLHDDLSLQAYKRAYALLKEMKAGLPITMHDFDGWHSSQVRNNRNINFPEFKGKSSNEIKEFVKSEFNKIEFFKKSKRFRRFAKEGEE